MQRADVFGLGYGGCAAFCTVGKSRGSIEKSQLQGMLALVFRKQIVFEETECKYCASLH